MEEWHLLFVPDCHEAWWPIVAALASIAGNVITSSINNNKQRHFQAEQQEKQNQFNAEQAEISRRYQTQMSNTEMSRRVSDLRSAGLNPAFASSLGGASIGSVPTASSSPVSAPHENTPMIDPEALSRIEVNEATAEKLHAETEKTEKETDWMDVLNQSTIDYQGSYVEVNGSVKSLNEQQKEYVAQKIKESQQQVENLRKQVEEMDSQITLNDIDAFWKSGKYASEIEQLKSACHLNDASAKEILYLMTSKKNLMNAQAASARADVPLKRSQERYYNASSTEHFWLGRMAYWDAGSSRISYQLYDKFGEFDKYFDYTTRGIDSVCRIADSFLGWKKALGKLKQGERALDQRDRALDQQDRAFQQRQIEYNDRQYNSDRSFKQHERDFGERMREQQREFNANWNQRERHFNEMSRRYRRRYDE